MKCPHAVVAVGVLDFQGCQDPGLPLEPEREPDPEPGAIEHDWPSALPIPVVFARVAGPPTVAGAPILVLTVAGELVELTSGGFNDHGPDVSPDGRRIAFMRDVLGDRNSYDPAIHVMRAGGSGPTRLAGSPACDPDWSPDGRTIAFLKGINCAHSYPFGGCYDAGFILRTDSQSGHELATGTSPAWSADGRNIAYAAFECDYYWNDCTQTGIGIVRADGTMPFRLTPMPGASPAWRQ